MINSSFRRFLGLFATCFALSNCSVLYDLSPDQCETKSDCAKFGTGYQCETGVCVCAGTSCAATGGSGGNEGGSDGNGATSGQPSGGSSGDVFGGTGGTPATAGTGAVAGSDGDAGASGAAGTTGVEPPECDGHDDCTDTVRPKACVEGRCVDLKTDPECPVILPRKSNLWAENLSDPDAIILGGFTNLGEDLQSNELRNYDLALTELTERVGGYSAASGQRPVVMVVCDKIYDTPQQLNAAADHLINDLRVPGIVSYLEADDLQRVFVEYGRDRDVFFMSPVSPDANLTNLPDDGLMWHALSSTEQLGLSYKPLLTRALASLAPTEPARVALLTATGVRDLGELGRAIEDVIEFNGKSASANGSDFLSMQVISYLEDRDALQDTVAQELREFAPDVVIAIGSVEILQSVIPLVEGQWSTVNPGKARPFYLLSPYHYNQTGFMSTLLSQYPSVRSRMVGVNWPAAEDPSVYNKYLDAFDMANPDVRGDPSTRGYENFYDAPYYLLYAIAGSGLATTPVFGGSAIATGMTRLLSGPSYDVGTADMPNAFALLRQPRTSISLIGAMGPPNFDELSGTRLDAGSVWCVDDSKAFLPDVLRYDATDATLRGTFPAACFSGF